MLEAFPESAMACARPYWNNMVYPYELTPNETFQFDYLGSPVTVNGFADTLIKVPILKAIGGLPTNYISGDTFVKRKIAMYYNILLISNGVSWWRMPEGQASSKVRGTLLGILESLKISIEFLSHADCPLSPFEEEIGRTNIYAGYYRYLVRNYLFKLKIPLFYKYWIYEKHSLADKIKYLMTPIELPFKYKNDAVNPLIEELSKNPFAKTPKL
jgi:hypothetical protein